MLVFFFAVIVMVMLVFFFAVIVMVMLVFFLTAMTVMMFVLVSLVFGSEARKLCPQRILLFHGGENGLAFQLAPRRRNNSRGVVFFFQQLYAGSQFFL